MKIIKMKIIVAVAAVLGFTLQVVASGMVIRQATDMIVVHHSETEVGNVETFRTHHININGWADIGYHYVIANGRGGLDGAIQKGRREDLQGAHAGKSGQNRNSHSIGVCLVGKGDFTSAQRKALTVKIVELCWKYKIVPSAATIQVHHEKCPGLGLNLQDIIVNVRGRLSARQQPKGNL